MRRCVGGSCCHGIQYRVFTNPPAFANCRRGQSRSCSPQAISSSAALFLRPVHLFPDSGPALHRATKSYECDLGLAISCLISEDDLPPTTFVVSSASIGVFWLTPCVRGGSASPEGGAIRSLGVRGGTMSEKKLILSLCDHTGHWARYLRAQPV